MQPVTGLGRVHAAVGDVFIALERGVTVDGFRPERYALLGALVGGDGRPAQGVGPRTEPPDRESGV